MFIFVKTVVKPIVATRVYVNLSLEFMFLLACLFVRPKTCSADVSPEFARFFSVF